MSDTEVLDFSAIVDSFVPKATRYVASRYKYYVTREDVSQELFVWLYGAGVTRVRRWLESSPQQTTRIYRSLVDVGRSYAEVEKASRAGYETDDIFWYSQSMIEGLMPLVLDPTFDGTGGTGDDSGRKQKKAPQEGGDLLATVMDIRRAIAESKDWVRETFLGSAPGETGWDDAVTEVVNRLGGERPHVGRRRVQSNSQAQYQTKEAC